MFWSLILEPGKTYSSTVKESFHLSMATLDVKSVKNDSDIFPVVIEIDGQQLLLCNLCKPHNLHANLDLVFQQGTNLTFSTSGKATIHLTGYCIQDDVDDMEGYSSSEDEEDESFKNMLENYKKDPSNSKSASKKEAKGATNQASPNKRKLEPVETISKKKAKVPKDDEDDDDDSSLDDEELGKLVDSINDEDMESDSDDDLEDEEDDDGDGGEDSDELESDGDEDAEDDSDDSDEESEDEKRKQPVAKGKKEEKTPLQNKQNKTPISNKKQDKQGKNQLSNGLTPQSSKKDKKEKNQANQATPKQDAQKTPKKNETASPQPQKKQTTVGGVIIEELKPGNGPVAKPGKMVSVYYTGRLKSNNRVFDQTNQGPGFKFRLGNNEVIKGWDIGVSGMKVGSKRRITCPPGVAYGNKGSPPQIPPNSTLVFEVELKSVN